MCSYIVVLHKIERNRYTKCGHPPHLADEEHRHRDYKCIRTHFCGPCVRIDSQKCMQSGRQCAPHTHTQTHARGRCLRANRNCISSIHSVILCDKVMFYAIKWDKFIIRSTAMHPKRKMLERKCTHIGSTMPMVGGGRCTPARALNTVTSHRT